MVFGAIERQIYGHMGSFRYNGVLGTDRELRENSPRSGWSELLFREVDRSCGWLIRSDGSGRSYHRPSRVID
jgi:hypothetical protein